MKQTKDRIRDDSSSPLKPRGYRSHQDGEEAREEHKESHHSRLTSDSVLRNFFMKIFC